MGKITVRVGEREHVVDCSDTKSVVDAILTPFHDVGDAISGFGRNARNIARRAGHSTGISNGQPRPGDAGTDEHQFVAHQVTKPKNRR